MSNKSDLHYLDKKLAGPILRVEDPTLYTEEDIIKSYYREIVLIAGKFTRPGIERADLVAEGIIGLLDAIKRWDPKKAKGNPRNFHNLAIIRIKNGMYNYFLENSGAYKFPSYMARGLNYLSQVRKAVEDSGYPDDITTVIRNWECPEFDSWAPENAVKKVRDRKSKIRDLAVSIKQDYETTINKLLKVERDIEEYEQSNMGRVQDPEEITANKEFIRSFLDSLNPEARDIIQMSLDGMTLEEIGDAKEKTRQRIQQIRSKILSVLKDTRMYKSSFGK